MNIRKATESDARAVAAIIIPIIREGITYTLDPAMSEAEARPTGWGTTRKRSWPNRTAWFSAPTICGQIRPAADDTSATAVTSLMLQPRGGALRAACANIRWNMRALVVTEQCSSTL